MSDIAAEAAVPLGARADAEDHAPVLALHEDRIRRTDLAIMAYQQSVTVTAADARRAHRNSRWAWCLAGVTVTGLFVAVVWATHTVTKADAEVTHLQTQVRQLADTSDSKTKEAQKLQKDAETARIEAARASGELSAAKVEIGRLTESHKTLEAKLVAVAESQVAQTAAAQERAATAGGASASASDTSAALAPVAPNHLTASFDRTFRAPPATQPAAAPSPIPPAPPTSPTAVAPATQPVGAYTNTSAAPAIVR